MSTKSHVGDIIVDNIKVDSSIVGVLNTGSIQSVDASITNLKQGGNEQLAEALSTLTDSVIASSDLLDKTKDELIEILSYISSELTVPPEQIRKAIAKSVIKKFEDTINVSAKLTQLWTTWRPGIVYPFS
ncbi:MAG: hypothetical protein R2568_03155 [Candidatus Scalindua sp.]|jgi:hypothetical protein|nr:hypothetical protein [Candidatus Scalindua sp.]